METNFNTPQRQSSVGILVMFLNTLQKFGRAFLPIIFIWFFNSKQVSILYILLAIFGVILLIGLVAYLQYLNFTFYIDEKNDEFIVNDGIINKTKTTIQLNKIQQVNIHQNLVQRIINVYGLSVDTAGSDTKEGKIKAISHSLALALKSKLLENEIVNNATSAEEITSEINEDVKSETHPFLKINLVSLIKVGITSNYVKSIGLILTFFFTILENLRQIGKEDLIDQDKIEKTISNYPVVYGVMVFILAMFTIVFIINIARTVVKFYNYSIAKQKGSLLLSYGLISTESTI
jgi:putative membrane protein